MMRASCGVVNRVRCSKYSLSSRPFTNSIAMKVVPASSPRS